MTGNDQLRQKLFFGTVDEKLEYAEELYQRFGKILLEDQPLCSELKLLDEYSQQVNSQMVAMRMGEQCSHCASLEGGGCCSNYMAGETDVLQILMNLLLGIETRKNSESQTECCYLQKNGCLFGIKPMFCLNYICTNIKQTATDEEMHTLQELTSKLLGKQYEVEKMLLNLVRKLSANDKP